MLCSGVVHVLRPLHAWFYWGIIMVTRSQRLLYAVCEPVAKAIDQYDHCTGEDGENVSAKDEKKEQAVAEAPIINPGCFGNRLIITQGNSVLFKKHRHLWRWMERACLWRQYGLAYLQCVTIPNDNIVYVHRLCIYLFAHNDISFPSSLLGSPLWPMSLYSPDIFERYRKSYAPASL